MKAISGGFVVRGNLTYGNMNHDANNIADTVAFSLAQVDL